MNKLITGLIIGLLIGGGIGYFSYGLIHKQNPDFVRGTDFQMDEETKNRVTSFFDANPSDSEIETYCQENPMDCRYYCMEVNSNSNICDEISRPTGMGR